MTSLAPILPELILSIGAIVLMMVAAFTGRRGSGVVSWLAVALLVAATIALIGAPSHAGPLFDGFLSADLFGSFGKAIIFPAAAVAIVAAHGWFERNTEHASEYAVLILFSAVGMSVMVSATSLIALYVGLELQSLAAYVLASYRRTDERSAEAGLKYFVLGALASGILLFGMSLTYGFTGTTAFDGIRAALTGGLSTGAMFGLVFVLAGLAFKISAVPFHMWTPDVYEGAPTPVTLFFASAPKVAAVALLARVAFDAFGTQVDAWRQVVVFAALASIVVGALGAIGQSNIKRFLAYSSINNVGFILIGLATATAEGASAMLVYLAIYVPMTVGSFVAVLMLKDEAGEPVEAIADMAGLSRTRPALAWCIAVLMFSLAGIPPLFGFWGKLVVFQAAVQADLVVLAALGIAASVIGAFYYIKIVKIMFFDEPADTIRGKSDWAHWALLWICVIVMSPLGYLITGWLGTLADGAAAALFLVA